MGAPVFLLVMSRAPLARGACRASCRAETHFGASLSCRFGSTVVCVGPGLAGREGGLHPEFSRSDLTPKAMAGGV